MYTEFPRNRLLTTCLLIAGSMAIGTAAAQQESNDLNPTDAAASAQTVLQTPGETAAPTLNLRSTYLSADPGSTDDTAGPAATPTAEPASAATQASSTSTTVQAPITLTLRPDPATPNTTTGLVHQPDVVLASAGHTDRTPSPAPVTPQAPPIILVRVVSPQVAHTAALKKQPDVTLRATAPSAPVTAAAAPITHGAAPITPTPAVARPPALSTRSESWTSTTTLTTVRPSLIHLSLTNPTTKSGVHTPPVSTAQPAVTGRPAGLTAQAPITLSTRPGATAPRPAASAPAPITLKTRPSPPASTRLAQAAPAAPAPAVTVPATTSAPAVSAPPVAAGTITDVPAGHWSRDAVRLLIDRNIVLGFPDGTFRGNQTLTRYEAAAMFARLFQMRTFDTPAVKNALTPADLDVIVNAVHELSAQITTIDARLTDAITEIDLLRTRQDATDTALQQVVTVAATHTEVQAVSSQITAQTTAALTTKADSADVSALSARVADLEAQLNASKQAETDRIAANTPTVPMPTPQTLPDATFTPKAPPSIAFGVGIGKTLGRDGLDISATLEKRRVIAGLDLKATVSYNNAAGTYGAQVNVVRQFDAAPLIHPYVGLGVGLSLSPDLTDATRTASDTFGSLLAGVNYDFTDTLQLYGEIDGRYYFSKNGQASGTTDLKSPSAKAILGAKFLF